MNAKCFLLTSASLAGRGTLQKLLLWCRVGMNSPSIVFKLANCFRFARSAEAVLPIGLRLECKGFVACLSVSLSLRLLGRRLRRRPDGSGYTIRHCLPPACEVARSFSVLEGFGRRPIDKGTVRGLQAKSKKYGPISGPWRLLFVERGPGFPLFRLSY